VVFSTLVVALGWKTVLQWFFGCAFVARWFFLWCLGVFSAFDGACFAAIGFFRFFGGDLGMMSLSWLELAPPKLNNGSCVDGE
jgi:hypothetical protein